MINTFFNIKNKKLSDGKVINALRRNDSRIC